jgi:hypothetical protein
MAYIEFLWTDEIVEHLRERDISPQDSKTSFVIR